jgi:hypothetical protein
MDTPTQWSTIAKVSHPLINATQNINGYGSIPYVSKQHTPTPTYTQSYRNTSVSKTPTPGSVTYDKNGNTIIHGKPNIALLKRNGNTVVEETKNISNSGFNNKKDVNLKNLENDIDGPPTLKYVSSTLSNRIISARNMYPNSKTGKTGITQKELAELVEGINIADIKAIENKSTPAVYNSKIIGRICNKLNISASNT